MNEEQPSISQLPPHSIEAERGILGCCLLAPTDSLTECAERLPSVEAFYDLRHRTLYQVLLGMVQDSVRIDLITLVSRLNDLDKAGEAGGIQYVSEHVENVPSAANLSFYIEIALEQYTRRRIITAATRAKIAAKSVEPAQDVLGHFEQDVMGIRDRQEMKAITGTAIGNSFISDAEDAHRRQGKIAGTSYGLPNLDWLTGGMHPTELVIIAARPSIGKTALGGSICLETAIFQDPPVPTLFVTMEMSAKALVRRLGCGLAGLSIGHFRSGRFQERDFPLLTSAAKRLSKAPLWIEQHLNGITAAKLRAVIRHHVRKNGVKIVVVDYLQKVKPDFKKENRTYEVAQVSEALKAEADGSNVAMIALAQLNRDAENNRPTLKDLADSGQLERDADTVILIHRDREEKEGEAILYVEKQRDGEVGLVKTHYVGRLCRFYPQEKEEAYQQTSFDNHP